MELFFPKHKNATEPILVCNSNIYAVYNAGYVGSNINTLMGISNTKYVANHLKPFV